MLISIIVAAAENGVIGNSGTMPWRMPSDLKRFRALTMGKPVVMGRKTFQSLPKALDGRANIVISRDRGFQPAGAITAPSLEAALAIARQEATARGAEEIMIIGGGEIYAAALAQVQRVYLTRIQAALPGDTYFPELSEAEWQILREEPLPHSDKDDHAATFIVLERRANSAIQPQSRI